MEREDRNVGALRPVGCPHCAQNLAVAETWWPQFAQTGARAAAHSSQNFASALFSCWQAGQIIHASKRNGQTKKGQSKVASGATGNKSVFRASFNWLKTAWRHDEFGFDPDREPPPMIGLPRLAAESLRGFAVGGEPAGRR
jgi:hypothetical protein